jgi:hypothetical protein
VAWLQAMLVAQSPAGVDLVPGFRSSWAGQGVEVHDAAVAGAGVGFAVRWHGTRPALIWHVEPARTLTCRALDPAWSTVAGRGEALLRPYQG